MDCGMTNQDQMEVEDAKLNYLNIAKALTRISPYVQLTPVFSSSTMNSLASGKHLYFKAEFLQKTGSFKARGAANAVILAKESGMH